MDLDIPDVNYHSSNSKAVRDMVRRPLVKLPVGVVDMPPEGVVAVSELRGTEFSAEEKKLSAKEELQLKVKQIAQELADEPIQHVRSLDSPINFNGYNVTAGPSTSNVSLSFFL